MKIFSMLHGDGLRGRSVRSSLFTLLNVGSENLLRLAGNLLLTRILFPEAFGIMALVQVVMAGLKMFSDTGIRLSIIQNERGVDPLFLDTAWTMQICRGITLWLLTWLAAAPVAAFYEAPILAELLPVAGLTALFQGFNSTKLASANRELTIGRSVINKVLSRLAGLIALVVLAWQWQSVWALVIGGLVAPFLQMVMSHLLLPGRNNRLRFDPAAARELFRFGKYIFLSTIAGFVVLYADRAVLGKFVSLSELAFYNIAILLATLPLMLQRRLFERVMVPLISRRPPAESAQNYRNIAKARLLVTSGAFLAFALMAVGGNYLVILLYDPRYEAAGPLLVLMAIAALPGLVCGGHSTMVVALGDSRRFALLVTASAAVNTAVLFLAVSHFGVIGAAISPFFASILFYPALIWFILPYKGWTPHQDIGFSLAGLAIAGLAVWVNHDAMRQAFETFALP